jgi:hypothetical protein
MRALDTVSCFDPVLGRGCGNCVEKAYRLAIGITEMKWEDDMKGLLKTGVAVSILALCVGGAHAQGRPDLQGFWSNQSVTRMERPQGVDKLKVSEAEAIELERSSNDGTRSIGSRPAR